TRPSLNNLDVFVRFITRQSNQIPRHIGTTHRLTHIKYKHFSVFPHCASMRDQLDDLGYLHKLPAHRGVWCRNRATQSNLLLENGDNAPSADKDVAKTH